MQACIFLKFLKKKSLTSQIHFYFLTLRPFSNKLNAFVSSYFTKLMSFHLLFLWKILNKKKSISSKKKIKFLYKIKWNIIYCKIKLSKYVIHFFRFFFSHFIKTNCLHEGPEPVRWRMPPFECFKGILAGIYTNFGEKHKLRTIRSTSATGG